MHVTIVMVWAQVGKDFLDMRQNERETNLLEWETNLLKWLNSGPAQRRTDIEQESLVHFYIHGTRSGIGSCGSFADWMKHINWVEGRVKQIPSPYGIGEETITWLRRTEIH